MIKYTQQIYDFRRYMCCCAVEWVRAKFAPSQKKKWKSQFKKHFANRNARPWKTTEDDDPSSAVNATAMDA